MASAALGDRIAAVVSRGGRPDLARDALPNVKSPTLLIVGGMDDVVMQLNEEAYAKLRCEKELRIVPGASHLFSETGKLEEVARMSAEWFLRHMNDAC
jgi:putative phosphoribosyl transferase